MYQRYGKSVRNTRESFSRIFGRIPIRCGCLSCPHRPSLSDTAGPPALTMTPSPLLDLVVAARVDDRGQIMLLDVRSPALFARGHIPGALNLPHGKIVRLLNAGDALGSLSYLM